MKMSENSIFIPVKFLKQAVTAIYQNYEKNSTSFNFNNFFVFKNF